MIKYKYRLLLGILICSVVVPAYGYDPMRAMRNGQITSGLSYSTFDPITSHGMVASPNVIKDEPGSIGLSLVNLNLYFQVADVDDLRGKIETLVEDASEVQPDFDTAIRFQKEVDKIVAGLVARGSILKSMSSVSTLPTITWSSDLIKGSMYFDHQTNPSLNGVQLPYATAGKVNSGKIGLNSFCGKDENSDGIPDDEEGFDGSKCKITTSATVSFLSVVKYASYSFGYSRKVLSIANEDSNFKSGDLVAGVRANYFSLKTAVYQREIGQDDNFQVNDIVDELATNTKINDGIDFDLGLSWISSRYVAGVTIANLATPDIKYSNGDKVSPGVPIAIHGTWLFMPDSKRWGLHLYNDMTGQKDPMNETMQWRTWSVGYASQSWYIPGVEIGKRRNLGKDGLSYTDFGLKLFKLLRLQMAWSDKRVSSQGSASVPRSAMFSLNFGLNFGFNF